MIQMSILHDQITKLKRMSDTKSEGCTFTLTPRPYLVAYLSFAQDHSFFASWPEETKKTSRAFS